MNGLNHLMIVIDIYLCRQKLILCITYIPTLKIIAVDAAGLLAMSHYLLFIIVSLKINMKIYGAT